MREDHDTRRTNTTTPTERRPPDDNQDPRSVPNPKETKKEPGGRKD
jgi:hypothetical protein